MVVVVSSSLSDRLPLTFDPRPAVVAAGREVTLRVWPSSFTAPSSALAELGVADCDSGATALSAAELAALDESVVPAIVSVPPAALVGEALSVPTETEPSLNTAAPLGSCFSFLPPETESRVQLVLRRNRG